MNKLHLIVRDQFPEFVREDYPVFVAFVEAYYKWIDQTSAGTLEEIKSLDSTPEEFVQYFRSQLDTYGLFNQTTPFNNLYLQKIKQIYAAKGSEQALVNVLRLSRNAETEVRYPSEQILRTSDGKWQQDSFITVQTVFGTIPSDISEFYINYENSDIRIEVKQWIRVAGDKLRLYYKLTPKAILPLNQRITINDQNNNAVYSGRVIKSPSYLKVISGGQDWQLGQIIVVPGTIKDTIAKVDAVNSLGAVTRVQILEHGYDHSENQLITVSPYPNKPLGSTYNISSVLISTNPVAYQHTLDVYDYTEGTEEKTVGFLSGIGYKSYFLENYVEPTYNGDVVLNVSSILLQQESSVGSDITMEQWLASRATFSYEFDPVVNLKGKWLDESGQISNQTIRLEDNYYYQQYSYDVEATVNSNEYIDLANTIHPAGMKMFTTYNLVNDLEIIPLAETTFPFLRSDLLDVATMSDEQVKYITKPRVDSVESLENISSKLLDKYFIDSVTASSTDTSTFSKSTYDSELYFAEGYVVKENTLNIGV